MSLAIVTISLLAACGQGRPELRLIVPRSPVDKEIAEHLTSLLDEESSVGIRLVPNPSPETSALAALTDGAGDIALVSNSESFRREIETVLPLYPTVLHIAYRDSIPIPTRGEAIKAGSRIFAGPPGSPSQLMLLEVAKRDGIDPREIEFVRSVDEQPDIVVVFAPVLPNLMDGAPDFQLFSIADPHEVGMGSVVDGAALLNPHLRPFVIPIDTYGHTPKAPVVTLAVDKLLVARSDVPETVVYDLIREILRLKPALSANNPGLFHQLSANFDISSTTFVVHPGARAFVSKDEPSVYERYSGVAEVAATLIFGLISGLYAAVKIYSIRRKNRIDRFYKAAMEVRDAAQGSSDLTVRRKAVSELRALQNDAFRMLVDEKLAADESFRIFITLSNDIIGDLNNPNAFDRQAGS